MCISDKGHEILESYKFKHLSNFKATILPVKVLKSEIIRETEVELWLLSF